MGRDEWFLVCENADCPSRGETGGAEGYWESVLASRVNAAPQYCPVCGEPVEQVERTAGGEQA